MRARRSERFFFRPRDPSQPRGSYPMERRAAKGPQEGAPAVDREPMPDPKNSQNEQSRKARSFGSYALFVLVLVAILVTYGGKKLREPAVLSQDLYEYYLYTGQVDKQEFLGTTEVEGELRGGDASNRVRFKVLV